VVRAGMKLNLNVTREGGINSRQKEVRHILQRELIVILHRLE
jgi:hypothetical protein